MKFLLVKDVYWMAVKKDKPEPATETWTNRDELALATFGLAVKNNQLVYIKRTKTANEAR